MDALALLKISKYLLFGMGEMTVVNWLLQAIIEFFQFNSRIVCNKTTHRFQIDNMFMSRAEAVGHSQSSQSLFAPFIKSFDLNVSSNIIFFSIKMHTIPSQCREK